ncbi:MAG: AmmeMemoRadiSam system protein B [Candidatus Omnitrophica bacterium]|jgi:AmmeMemoRadiSam system protein B|nr:AmmeMemoRadiSam system protein B [Candidatus Omnitrophota bacterium]
MEKIRNPVVDGYFYPADKPSLLKMLKEYIKPFKEKHQAISVICPHAGYIYSGRIAGSIYGRIEIPDNVIILGPNHHGFGEPFAVMEEGVWKTPLGDVEINKILAGKIIENSKYLQTDTLAHNQEHSLEVQVPFLQYIKSNIKIVPIVLSGALDSVAWDEIGNAISQGIKDYNEKVLIVASSDFTHYETQQTAEENDKYAMEAIISLNEDLFIERIAEKDISICGYGSIITAIIASKNLGAKNVEIIDYKTSGDITGDYQQVVGYAGIIIR